MTHTHVDQDLLVDYAAGSLPEAPSLIVATHLACCAACRADVARLEDVGGALLAATEEAPVGSHALAAVLDRLDAPEPAAPAPALDSESRKVMPGPLARYVRRNLSDLRWRRVGPRIEEAVLATATPRYKTALLRVARGAAIPTHTHGGREFTLVLQGGIRDAGVEYRRGDLIARDQNDEHKPSATEDDDCICLVVLDAPVRLTGRLTRLLNPFLRH
jgi:putative transcriptional regulator